MNKNFLRYGYLLSIVVTLLAGCGGGSDSQQTPATDTATDTSTDTSTDTTTPTDNSDTGTAGEFGLQPTLFLSDALIGEVTTEACTLSGGTDTTCYRLTIAGQPANVEIGPFCPPSIDSDDSEGGVWFDGSGELYQLDGDFIVNLDTIYGDDWLLYDPATGEVNITDTQIACEAAARPDVDPEYQNHCVECRLEYLGGAVSQTFLIPVEPVPLSSPAGIRGDVGISLNGVAIAAPAPVDAILSANTIAAFDDCGGHVNPIEGYHYHAELGCSELTIETNGHAGLIGYALDGYGIYAMLNAAGEEDVDLDACRGHSDDVRGYHYHAASAAENMFIGCYSGEQGTIE